MAHVEHDHAELANPSRVDSPKILRTPEQTQSVYTSKFIKLSCFAQLHVSVSLFPPDAGSTDAKPWI